MKPITEAGVGMAEGACAPASEGAANATIIAARRRIAIKRSDVDLAKLVGGLEHVADLAGKGARLDGRAVDVADGRLHTG